VLCSASLLAAVSHCSDTDRLYNLSRIRRRPAPETIYSRAMLFVDIAAS